MLKLDRSQITLQDWYTFYRSFSTFERESRWDSYVRARLAVLFYRKCFDHGFFV